MDELSALRERLATERPVAYDAMPDFPLYMDQMLSYMERQVLRFDGDDGLTAAMVNNYTKSGLLPRAEGKKYNREHLCYLTAVCILKQVMSVKDVELLLSAVVPREDVAGGYEEMATHTSILAWKISWIEEPGGLQSMGSQSWTQLSDFTI